MIKVTQEIPDGRFCATEEFNRDNKGNRCIFLDRGNERAFRRGLDMYCCRRHPDVALGIEFEAEKQRENIVKCHACQKETCGGEFDAETGATE